MNQPANVGEGLGGATAGVDERLIRAELTRVLYSLLPLALVFSTLAAVVVALSLRTEVVTLHLAVWVVVLALVTLARAVLVVAYHRIAPAAQAHGGWLAAFRIGACLAGSAWGAAIPLLLPVSDPLAELVLVIAVAGVSAGAVTTLSPVWSVTLLFLLPAVLPVIAVYAPRGQGGVATLALLFVAGLLITSRRQARLFRENARLQLELTAGVAALRDREARYRLIFQNTPLGVFSYDANGTITECNDEFVAIIGSSQRALVGVNLFRDLSDERLKAAARASLETGRGEYEGDYASLTADKTTPVRALFRALPARDGERSGGVAVVEDYSDRREAAAIIERQASYDPLTDLANRRLLLQRLEDTLAARRMRGERAGLAFLDLDHFKRINDSLGHAVGDELLTAVAGRLAGTLREGDTAARLSGDEFVALVSRLGERGTPAEELDDIGHRIIQRLSAPYHIRGYELHVTPSVGMVVFPRGSESALDVLTHADTAMYRAKAAGRATRCLFQPSMQAEVDERLALESDLRDALLADAVVPHYQMVVNRRGAVVGAEALARWHHPERGDVSPGRFIPIAEESGLIVALGERMLRRACEQLAAADDLPRVSVNVSPRQFRESGFVAGVEAVLDETGVAPDRLILEVTENLLVENLELAAETMHRLQARGVRFSIDDFGMGYSSLAYLKRLPLDILKIDQHFVRDVTTDRNDAAIIETVLSMAHHLGLSVIAEGVETQAQFEFLRARGCRYFQGFLFSRPAPLESHADGDRSTAEPRASG